MTALEVWLVIAGLTLVTIMTRSAFFVIGGGFQLPGPVQQGLRYAPVCALMALIAPELALADGGLALSFGNPKLVAGAVAAVVVLGTRSMVLAMTLGMAVFALLRFALA
jgi:branched-subunit amino acid transport protein